MGDFDCCPHVVGPEEDEMSTENLIGELREQGKALDEMMFNGRSVEGATMARAADALEGLTVERDALAADVERLRLVHAGQARLAMLAVYLADVDGDEGTQAFYQEWVRNHDAALIESLADEAREASGYTSTRSVRRWLRSRAQQIREGKS